MAVGKHPETLMARAKVTLRNQPIILSEVEGDRMVSEQRSSAHNHR